MLGILVKQGARAAMVARHAFFGDDARDAEWALGIGSIVTEVLNNGMCGCDSRAGGGGGSHGTWQLGLARPGGICVSAAFVAAYFVVRFAGCARGPLCAALDLRGSVTADVGGIHAYLSPAAESAGLGNAFAHLLRGGNGWPGVHGHGVEWPLYSCATRRQDDL